MTGYFINRFQLMCRRNSLHAFPVLMIKAKCSAYKIPLPAFSKSLSIIHTNKLVLLIKSIQNKFSQLSLTLPGIVTSYFIALVCKSLISLSYNLRRGYPYRMHSGYIQSYASCFPL